MLSLWRILNPHRYEGVLVVLENFKVSFEGVDSYLICKPDFTYWSFTHIPELLEKIGEPNECIS